MKFIGKIGGRKFIMAVFTCLAVALHESLGISPEVVMTIGGIAAAYCIGQGAADAGSKGATSSTTPDVKE